MMEVVRDRVLGGSEGCGRFSCTMLAPLGTPGRDELTAELCVELYAEPWAPPADARPRLVSRPITLTAACEILAEEPADLIRLVRTPELDRQVLSSVFLERPTAARGARVSVGVRCSPRQNCNLAFDVYAEFPGDRAIRLGQAVFPPRGSRAPAAAPLTAVAPLHSIRPRPA